MTLADLQNHELPMRLNVNDSSSYARLERLPHNQSTCQEKEKVTLRFSQIKSQSIGSFYIVKYPLLHAAHRRKGRVERPRAPGQQQTGPHSSDSTRFSPNKGIIGEPRCPLSSHVRFFPHEILKHAKAPPSTSRYCASTPRLMRWFISNGAATPRRRWKNSFFRFRRVLTLSSS